MYQLGHRFHRHYVRLLALIIVLLLIVGGVLAARAYFQPHTIITQSPAVTKYVPASTTTYQHITTNRFAIDLPSDWKPIAPPQTPYTAFSYHGTTTASTPQRLDIYLGNVPLDLAVNRLLPVQADTDHMDITGVVSDNCTNFTDKTPSSASAGTAPSRWGGVNFICDMGNYERQVVAIGSTEGVNTITLTATHAGRERVLLVYVDNNINPNYNIFLSMVKSFQLL